MILLELFKVCHTILKSKKNVRITDDLIKPIFISTSTKATIANEYETGIHLI